MAVVNGLGHYGRTIVAIRNIDMLVRGRFTTCDHMSLANIARAFMGAGTSMPVDRVNETHDDDERMWTALVDVGPSRTSCVNSQEMLKKIQVLSGITFTKLIGISVLALARSRLLKV